jgi:hypothetical protein
LRRSTPEDAERLSAFNAHIHGNPEEDKPDERVGIWTRDLLEKPHPSFNPDDFTIVEDTHSGQIVSSLNRSARPGNRMAGIIASLRAAVPWRSHSD